MDDVKFGISEHVPCRDADVCEKVRAITREEIDKPPNPDVSIEVIPDGDIASRRINDLFARIKASDEQDQRLVMILPQPHPQYIKVAERINEHRVNCRNLYTFNMDEWADEDGRVAPETWPRGFMYAMLHNFYYRIDEELRPAREQIQGVNDKNLNDYGKMMEDLGGVDLCDGGIGWSGHVAFVEPGSPEFAAESIEEFRELGTRLVTLNPFTIAQASMDADYGMSGDWSLVPPRAATIGPKEILSAKVRHSWNHFTLASTDVSWQRFSVRLAMHGPVSMDCPASILQLEKTNFYLSETIAQTIECDSSKSFYA
jgi:glucosamine-6-phosphate deaminase